MGATKRLDELCTENKMTVPELAEKANIDESKAMAIVLGRWTPSPEDRDKLSSVFGLTREEITWGHKTPIQHLYGHGPG